VAGADLTLPSASSSATSDSGGPAEADATPAPSPVQDARSRSFLPGGWPLTLLFLLFPVWWAFGLSTFIFIILAIPMAAFLIRKRDLWAPRGFGFWLLFVAWMLIGVTMLWADAPGAEPGGGGGGRLMVFGFRAATYLAATIVFLYVLNSDERDLPNRRVVRLLALMFVFTVCGGVLGVVAPRFEFTSVLEFVLPHGLAKNEFVNGMIHPAAADIQKVLGYEQSRPIAPFSFSNSWGSNLSMYLPFFLLAWFGKDAGWRRFVAPVVLLAALAPVVYSLNRGLWAALAVGAVYLAVRLAMLGRFWLLQLMGGALIIGVIVFFASPLAGIVQQRMEHQHSNDRREQLATETIRSVVTGSPILGFGSTRDVQGTFASIAGGSTPDCPACGVPPLGTQGQFWLVLFSQGLVGVALFCAFFLRRFVAHIQDPWPVAIAGCCVLLFFGLELPIYDTLGAPLVTVMISLGLMARRQRSMERAR
jgi:hypothetical protein